MNKILFVILAMFFVLTAIIYKRVHWENSAYSLRKSIGKVERLDVFTLPNNGADALFTTRDTDVIQEFLDAIEFQRSSLMKLISIKKPGVLEFVTTGITTQRLQWVEFGWGYLRAENSLLRSDVALTRTSSQQLVDWLKDHEIPIPECAYPE